MDQGNGTTGDSSQGGYVPPERDMEVGSNGLFVHYCMMPKCPAIFYSCYLHFKCQHTEKNRLRMCFYLIIMSLLFPTSFPALSLVSLSCPTRSICKQSVYSVIISDGKKHTYVRKDRGSRLSTSHTPHCPTTPAQSLLHSYLTRKRTLHRSLRRFPNLS